MLRNLVSRPLFLAGSFLLFTASAPVSADSGQELAELWCASCHVYPGPELLNRKTWLTSVLPDMGARLGFTNFRGFEFHPDESAPEGTYAEEPMLEASEFQEIAAYFENTAPERLTAPAWPPRTKLDLFSIEMPAKPADDFPANSAVFIDEKAHKVLVGDSFGMDVEIYDSDLELEAKVPAGGAVSRIARLPSGHYLAAMIGATISPTENFEGKLIEIAENNGSYAATPVLDGLHRPVDMAFGDFNGDGRRDYVTADYGAHTGGVVLHLSQPDGSHSEYALIDGPGASVLHLDGNDLWVLQAQAMERIVKLTDFADEDLWEEETAVAFPPPYGSTGLSVLDFNGDGLEDLLYTAGDNADMTPIFKPYHGIYLFSGQPDGSFRQRFFFPLDGAYSAIARDFDEDGDPDIAAISYYANIAHGLDEAMFVYLENTGSGFAAKSVEGLGSLGRFIAISAGDVDGDGDIDLALANMAASDNGPMVVPGDLQLGWIAGPHFVLLRNGLR